MTKDTILAKINKLLALANDRGASEAEAESAMQKAYAMLAEYNLSMSDVNDLSDEHSDEVDKDEYTELGTAMWKRYVYNSAAELYFCNYFYSVGCTEVNGSFKRYTKHTFIGTKHNTLIAKEMTMYFIDTIERLAKPYKGMGKRCIDSFKKGCAVRLSERISDHISKAKVGTAKDTDGKNLPAMLDMYEKAQNAIERYKQEKNIKVCNRNNRIEVDPYGYRKGLEAGNQIGLNNQVGSSYGKKGLLT